MITDWSGGGIMVNYKDGLLARKEQILLVLYN